MSHDCWNGQGEDGLWYLECNPHELWGVQEYAAVALVVALLVGLVVIAKRLSAGGNP